MKKLYFLSLIIATAALFFGCKKDENEPEPKPTPITEPEPKPKPEPTIVYDSSNVILLIKKADTEIFSNDYFSPKNEETDSRCFNKSLTIAFNSLIESPITIKVLDNLSYTYRYELTEFTISDASGDNLAENANLFDNNLKAEIIHKQLKPNTEYTVNLTVKLKQLVNEEWTPVIWNGNEVSYSNSYKFTTGSLPENTINKRDILHQYPIDRQYNYMPKEYTQGYIILSYGYENIFDGIADEDKKVIIKGINDNDFEKQVLPFTTKACHDVPGQVAEINYSLESVSFNPEKIYSIQLAVGLDTIYQMHFRTSRFNTLSEKLKAYDAFDGPAFVLGSDPINKILHRNLIIDEFFDDFEYQYFETIGPGIVQPEHLIHMDLDLDNCEWYKNTFKPMYDQYSVIDLKGENELNGSSRWVKFPPTDAIIVFNAYFAQHSYLTDDEIAKGEDKGLPTEGIIRFYSIYYMLNDANMLNYQIVQYEVSYTPGEYPYFISFVLPGKGIVTTKEKHVFIVE